MIPDCSDNKFELVFNEMVDAAELKNLPIDDDKMNGIIEEEEMEDEGSDGRKCLRLRERAVFKAWKLMKKMKWEKNEMENSRQINIVWIGLPISL